ncbi:MAG: NAD-dependent epimerase/dehydratase family protein, partial [Smithella sp.]|nr:NAD-dependent epimerase/dehydratase family protein [Smithella sp.]
MKILVTGSNGFLGSFFRNIFIPKEHEYVWGSISGRADSILFSPLYTNVSTVLKNKTIDAIIHFAAVKALSFEAAGYANTLLPNLEMMKNLYDFSLERKIS